MKRAHLGLERLGRMVLRDYGLTPARFDMLNTIWDATKPLSQTELTRRLGVVRSAVSEMLDALMELGLVKKYRAADGRTFIVQLTKHGSALMKVVLDGLLNNNRAGLWVDFVLREVGQPETDRRRSEWSGVFFAIGKGLGNDVHDNRDLYLWDPQKIAMMVIRPEDGETWGDVPWMDETWIAENSVEMVA